MVASDTINEQIQTTQEIFFDVVNGKLSIKDAREKAEEVASRYDYFNVKFRVGALDSYDPDSIEEGTGLGQLDPKTKREFQKRYSMYEARWKNGKWKERLKSYREMEK